jgi:sigma-E factor negative regulatory protein RseC
MRLSEQIRHNGVVMTVEGSIARVSITQASACQACKAKSMCMASESKEKVIEAVAIEPLQPGDVVEVCVRERLAWRAVILGYIAPFVVMMLVIAGLNWLTNWEEAIVGTVSLVGIALYYMILSLFKKRLEKQFSFTARKI